MTPWPLSALGKLMPDRRGTVDPTKFLEESFDLYSIPAFDSGSPVVVKGREIGSTKQVVRSGDVLLSKIVPHIRRAWVVGEDRGRRLIASSEWIVFEGGLADPQYLRHILVSDHFHAQFMRTVAGVGGSLLRARPTQVGRIAIPLPPLPEQRRIAAILDKAEELRAKRRAALEQLNGLTQSMFLEMFGDPATNPKGWRGVSLGSLVVHGPQNGLYKPSSDYGSGTRILRIDAFYDGMVTDVSSLKRVRISDDERALFGLAAGDIVINRVNSMEYLGKSALVPHLAQPVVFESNMMRLRVDPATTNSQYVVQALQTASIKQQIARRAKHAINQASVNQQDVCGLRLPLPPLQLQREYARRHEIQQAAVTKGEAALAGYDELFSALQHQAFSGAL